MSISALQDAAKATSHRPPGWSAGINNDRGITALMERIEHGVDAGAEKRLRDKLDLSLYEMAELLGTSPRTLNRRQEEGWLTPDESDRLYRYARLFERAVEVFGNEENARSWMKKKNVRLGGRIPLEFARFDPGAREVENLLGRLERGLPA